jgi:predicted PurR-regulated permease PerM
MSTPTDRHDAPPVRTIRHELSLRSVFSILGIAAGIWLLLRLWNVVLLLVIALILAGTVSPMVDWLERRRIKRPLALGLILLALFVVVVGLGALVIPAFVAQVQDLITAEPVFQTRLADFAAGIPALADRAEAIRTAQPTHLLEPFAPEALPVAGAAAQLVILMLTVVVLAFYLVADHERVQGFAFALLPRRFHLRAARVLLDMEMVVGGYVRGQALTSFLIGAFVFIVLWFAGTPHALALAVFAAFADLIPFVGGALALLPAVAATLPRGVLPAVVVFVAILLYQQVEGHLLIPRIYGQTLRLSPLAVLVALLVGGELLGIVGALLALPLAAGIRVLVEQLRIELPGEQPGETAQRATDEEAEALYAVQTEGASAAEAAVVATALAEDMQEQAVAETGQAEVPAEQQDDLPRPAVPPAAS